MSKLSIGRFLFARQLIFLALVGSVGIVGAYYSWELSVAAEAIAATAAGATRAKALEL